jgi:diaminopimelate decarboxylase
MRRLCSSGFLSKFQFLKPGKCHTVTNSTTEEGNDDNQEPPEHLTTDTPFWWERSDLHYCKNADAVFFGQACLEDILIDAGHLPTFVYRPARFAEKTALLRSVLPNATILYAVKANRHPAILAQALRSVDGIDVCSPNEARLALANGFAERQISYTGTSLSEADLDFLTEHPAIHINADSLSLLRRIGQRCPGRTIGIRINPEMGLGYRNEPRLVYSTRERPGKFGLLAEQLPEAVALAKHYRLHLNTVHWHIGCGWLNEQLDGLAKILDKATMLVSQLPDIENVNLGGGLGVPFQSDDATLSLQRWAEIVAHSVADRWNITLEPGSFLVQDAGVLLTRVNTVERKRNWLFAGVNAGFNLAMEPVFYGMRLEPFFLRRPEPTRPVEAVTIAGNINEAHDLLARDFVMPVPHEGEALGFLNAGAYAASMSSNHCLRGDFREVIVT